jgi:ankyrin repeat protein
LQIAGRTALIEAALYGHTECVKLLLRNGARCDLRDAQGHTAATIAKANGHDTLTTAIEFLQ